VGKTRLVYDFWGLEAVYGRILCEDVPLLRVQRKCGREVNSGAVKSLGVTTITLVKNKFYNMTNAV